MSVAIVESSSRLASCKTAVSNLAPGYFAFVMNAIIFSTALNMINLPVLSDAFLGLAAVGYIVLWVLYIWQISAYKQNILANLRNPEAIFAYYTVPAATNVLMVRFAGNTGFTAIVIVLAVFGVLLWLSFGYLLPWQVFMRTKDKPVLASVNGGWFLWCVATQSVSLGASKLYTQYAEYKDILALTAVLTWSVGLVLYFAMAILLTFRVLKHGVTPEKFDPNYWVSMGALAITIVAGVSITGLDASPVITVVKSLIAAATVIFWGFCVWLVPPLFAIGVWRHFIHKVPLKYAPGMWAMVFPMGMFSVASILVGRTNSIPLIENFGLCFLAVGFLAWTIVFIGNMRAIVRVLRAGK